jgi:hypothetical protein
MRYTAVVDRNHDRVASTVSVGRLDRIDRHAATGAAALVCRIVRARAIAAIHTCIAARAAGDATLQAHSLAVVVDLTINDLDEAGST